MGDNRDAGREGEKDAQRHQEKGNPDLVPDSTDMKRLNDSHNMAHPVAEEIAGDNDFQIVGE